jgi:hypothetical protein
LPLHCALPGTHSPAQALFWQTKGHFDVSCQNPLASQVWRAVILQRFDPGAHTPVHPEVAQTSVQNVPVSHIPSGPLQVKNVLPLHFVAPGRHTPVQAPLVQRAGQVISF